MEISHLLRKIRKERKITQKELAHNITTRESISKYENGENNIPFVILLEILAKLNLSMDEFVFYLDNDYVRNKNTVINAWLKKKRAISPSTNLFMKKLRTKAKETGDIADIRNYLIIRTHSWYALPVNERQLNKKDQEYVHFFMNYIDNIHEWGRFEMTSFSTLLFLFETPYICQRLQEIQKKIEQHSDFEIFHSILLSLYNNAFLLMLERKEVKLARKYLKKLQAVYHHSLFSHNAPIAITFYSALLAYLEGEKSINKKLLLDIFEGLKLLGMEELKKEFEMDLRKYEKIYDILPLYFDDNFTKK